MGNKYKILGGIAYGYVFLPFLIFLFGWVKISIALPMILILCYCYLKICSEISEFWMPEWNRENITKIIFIIGIIAIWVYYSGIGKFVFQNVDHPIRNGIFNILVEYQWPVVNFDILNENHVIQNSGKATGLIYYIGFWLPSALVGKILGIRAGYYMQAVWALLGIVLVYYIVCITLKRIAVWPLAILIFFSGLDILGIFLTGADPMDFEVKMHLEWWGTPYQYSSMTTQLFWVFNQAIPAWVCTMMVYIQKNNRNIVFILACCMLTSTFPFVGLLALVLFFCFSRKYDIQIEKKGGMNAFKKYVICLFKDTCTVQNVVGGGIIGITTFLYLRTNSSGSVIMGENTKGPQFENSLAKLIIFLILEIGIYGVLIYKYNKNNALYYFLILCLCIIPPIKVGYSTDFCMRVSIPLLMILIILVINTVSASWKKKDYYTFTGLILALIIGSATPVCEFKRTFTETFERLKVGEIVYAEDYDMIEILNSRNFSGDIDENLFFKYFIK